MSATWAEEQTRLDAQAIAHERLEKFDRERQERMAGYALVWETRWARQRAVVAGGEGRSLWRVK